MISIWLYIYYLLALRYLQIVCVVWTLYERINVFLGYKTLTIRLDNIVTIIFQKTISLPCQGGGKCLQSQLDHSRHKRWHCPNNISNESPCFSAFSDRCWGLWLLLIGGSNRAFEVNVHSRCSRARRTCVQRTGIVLYIYNCKYCKY